MIAEINHREQVLMLTHILNHKIEKQMLLKKSCQENFQDLKKATIAPPLYQKLATEIMSH
jgi:hypothetical protein